MYNRATLMLWRNPASVRLLVSNNDGSRAKRCSGLMSTSRLFVEPFWCGASLSASLNYDKGSMLHSRSVEQGYASEEGVTVINRLSIWSCNMVVE